MRNRNRCTIHEVFVGKILWTVGNILLKFLVLLSSSCGS